MKRSVLSFGFAFLFLSLPARAQSYACRAIANPARGFPVAFEIHVIGTGPVSQMFILMNEKQRRLGNVSEITTLSAKDTSQRPAFDYTLGRVSEPDVSGVAPQNLGRVSAIQIFKGERGENEVLVLRLFSGSRQIGGSFLISGMGTSCLP
jgi:hypothetical protein